MANKYPKNEYQIKNEKKFIIYVLTGNYFKKRIRHFKVILKNGDTFSKEFVNHNIIFKNNSLSNNEITPLTFLLNKFSKSILNTYSYDDLENVQLSGSAIKIIEKSVNNL